MNSRAREKPPSGGGRDCVRSASTSPAARAVRDWLLIEPGGTECRACFANDGIHGTFTRCLFVCHRVHIGHFSLVLFWIELEFAMGIVERAAEPGRPRWPQTGSPRCMFSNARFKPTSKTSNSKDWPGLRIGARLQQLGGDSFALDVSDS
jgi:hypothetical protein